MTINSISSSNSLVAALSQSNSSSSDEDAFGNVLAATQNKYSSSDSFKSDFEKIRDMGFTAWAQEAQKEALKDKMRQQIMSGMGLDEQTLHSMPQSVQAVLEQKIQEEVQKAMEQDSGQSGGTAANAQTAQAEQSQSGKKDQTGNNYPALPAVSWLGSSILL